MSKVRNMPVRKCNRPAIITMLVLLALTAGGCRREGPDREHPSIRPGSTQVYRCSDGYRFVARYEPERVWLFLPDRTVSLPQVPAISGFQFTNGALVLRGSGDRAFLEDRAVRRGDCVNRPAEVLWETARLNGVVYRAVGRDPSWTLEIAGRGITWRADDAPPQAFPGAAPVRAGGVTTYTSESAGRAIRVVVGLEDCEITGEQTEADIRPSLTVVTVALDGREYRGCGRPLQ